MKDRIRQLMESQHMNQQSFANFLGMAPATLSSILAERTRPTLNTVDAIVSKFPELSVEWLMFGKGEMFSNKEDLDFEDGDQHQSNMGSETTLSFDFDSPTRQDYRPQSPHRSARSLQGDSISSNVNTKNIDKPLRKITEIRVYFDDQTWESFVPKK